MGRILVVDDDGLVLRSVERLLKSAGHAVTGAHSGPAALQLASRRFFDVALVDYQLGTTSGVDLLQDLRELQPSCLAVLMSGALDTGAVIDGVNRGAVRRVIEKPFAPPTLLETVEDTLRLAAGDPAASDDVSEAQQALVECLEGDHLQLALQPIIRARNGRSLHAYEALLRSTHARLDGPGPVLGAAEDNGMIAPLADRVSHCATQWLDRLPRDIRLFVNLHPAELAHPKLLHERWQRAGDRAPRIVVEITERSRVLDFEAWRRSTAILAELGIDIAVDDLGAGYSSLSVLAELKPSYIKIDMSIVRNVQRDAHKRRLVELLCGFADSTDAALIAEGVETEAEADALLEAGVDLMQGYLFGKPSLKLD